MLIAGSGHFIYLDAIHYLLKCKTEISKIMEDIKNQLKAHNVPEDQILPEFKFNNINSESSVHQTQDDLLANAADKHNDLASNESSSSSEDVLLLLNEN